MVILRALAFAGCVVLDLLPGTEVDCHFAVPLAAWPAPAGGSADAPVACPAPPVIDPPAEQCVEPTG